MNFARTNFGPTRRHVGVGAVVLAGIAAAVASTNAPRPSAPLPPGYTLEWHDEFDVPISSDRWSVFVPPDRQSWARASRQAVGHDGSNLVLSAIRDERDFLFGWVSSQAVYRRRYGYFEARLATPPARGWRAAFWLMSPTLGEPIDRPDAAGAEVQILSRITADLAERSFGHAVYWNAPEGFPYLTTNRDGVVRVVSNAPPPAGVGVLTPPPADHGGGGFHTYGLLWTQREYVFFVDGRESWRTGRGVAQVPLFICLALLPDPRGPNRPMRVETPAHMFCDYVRVYAPPTEETPTGR
ncbi:MAG: glycoside hydrolase family 16 protein [Kiritimatiellae bacterium]|nr:glycoside hydrolase family 16 protein [Kiritimatiellia bacterium]